MEYSNFVFSNAHYLVDTVQSVLNVQRERIRNNTLTSICAAFAFGLLAGVIFQTGKSYFIMRKERKLHLLQERKLHLSQQRKLHLSQHIKLQLLQQCKNLDKENKRLKRERTTQIGIILTERALRSLDM